MMVCYISYTILGSLLGCSLAYAMKGERVGGSSNFLFCSTDQGCFRGPLGIYSSCYLHSALTKQVGQHSMLSVPCVDHAIVDFFSDFQTSYYYVVHTWTLHGPS